MNKIILKFALVTIGFLALCFGVDAQIPTNSVIPKNNYVMTDTNSILVAPTNFFSVNSNLLNRSVSGGGSGGSSFPLTNNVNLAGFAMTNGGTIASTNFFGNAANETNYAATNLTGAVLPANGGLGLIPTNIVPSGLFYDNGTGCRSPSGGYYSLPITTGQTYVAYSCTTNDLRINYGVPCTVNPHFNLPANLGLLFTPATNTIDLIGVTNTAVTVVIVPYSSNLIIGGSMAWKAGTLPDIALSTNVQLLSNPLYEQAGVGVNSGGLENYIMASNTANHSSLSIFACTGPAVQFSDVNFFTTASLNPTDLANAKLHGATGRGNGSGLFPYSQMYNESYNGAESWFYVGSGHIWGGLLNDTTNRGAFGWYHDYSIGGSTNLQFIIDPLTWTTTNYGNEVVASNLTAGSFTGNGSNVTQLQIGNIVTNGVVSGTPGMQLTLNNSGLLSWSNAPIPSGVAMLASQNFFSQSNWWTASPLMASVTTTNFINLVNTNIGSVSYTGYSPAINFQMNAWKTSSGGASQTGQFRMYGEGEAGSAHINGAMEIDWQGNSGWVPVLNLDNSGNMTVQGGYTGSGPNNFDAGLFTSDGSGDISATSILVAAQGSFDTGSVFTSSDGSGVITCNDANVNGNSIAFPGSAHLFLGSKSTGDFSAQYKTITSADLPTAVVYTNVTQTLYNTMTFKAGLATGATNLYTVTSTGFTNTGTKNIQVIGFTGTSVVYSNATSGSSSSLGTLTAIIDIVLKPTCSLKGTSCAGDIAEDF